MRIFIDSADLDEIREACSWGVVDGATTNPSLIKAAVDRRKGQIAMKEYIQAILRAVPGPVSLEVTALRADEMVAQAERLHGMFSPHGQPVIKIPVNPHVGESGDVPDYDGLRAIRRLSGEGIPTNATLVMTPEQALLAAKAGATYASPFAGRVDDLIRERRGLRVGVGFQKGDYFDPHPIRRIVEGQLGAGAGAPPTPRLPQWNRIGEFARGSHDNGVYGGVDLVRRILRIYRNYGYGTQVIAASMRNPRQVREVAELGVHVATVPFPVLAEMLRHPKTEDGVRAFTADTVPAYKELFEQK